MPVRDVSSKSSLNGWVTSFLSILFSSKFNKKLPPLQFDNVLIPWKDTYRMKRVNDTKHDTFVDQSLSAHISNYEKKNNWKRKYRK